MITVTELWKNWRNTIVGAPLTFVFFSGGSVVAVPALIHFF